MTNNITTLEKSIKSVDDSLFVDTLFDPVQTHAVKFVHAEDVDRVKSILKQHNATRFRNVQTIGNQTIMCFKLKGCQ